MRSLRLSLRFFFLVLGLPLFPVFVLISIFLSAVTGEAEALRDIIVPWITNLRHPLS